ncbi:MAG: rhomboid family intramembrane serine protease [Lutibacter sp.]|uniref:rhomboid family intramembrane serine protease n=1 Tax=Lutibacter sp. TaxID=1925666 RepID=UPI0019E15D8F|nr:rhomboid family intramembrane serine protease [Lutibacter sp.]NOR28135.1 rhomboid family intramembrane serine protease [Lutibacter sp.]
MSETNFTYKSNVIGIPLVTIILIWVIYFVEIKLGLNFNNYGIYPKSILGLRGVILSPFIHSDATHLFNNSIPLAVMLGCLYYFYQKIANKVLFIGLLTTGLLTWIIGRPSYHIGASGIIYLLVSFVFFSGIFRKYYRLIALSLAVVFLYGSMVWYIFPTEERISWEGHLSGFVTGFMLAFLYRRKGPLPQKFIFTKNEEFEMLFDEEGNFSPPEPVVEEENE